MCVFNIVDGCQVKSVSLSSVWRAHAKIDGVENSKRKTGIQINVETFLKIREIKKTNIGKLRISSFNNVFSAMYL